MKIRKENVRSYLAATKLPYCTLANEIRPDLYKEINQVANYNLFQIEKDQYHLYQKRALYSAPSNMEIKEA